MHNYSSFVSLVSQSQNQSGTKLPIRLIVDQIMPIYLFMFTPKLIKDSHSFTINYQCIGSVLYYLYLYKHIFYHTQFYIVYIYINIFSITTYKSLRKMKVGANRYTGLNWSTTTLHNVRQVMNYCYANTIPK